MKQNNVKYEMKQSETKLTEIRRATVKILSSLIKLKFLSNPPLIESLVGRDHGIHESWKKRKKREFD